MEGRKQLSVEGQTSAITHHQFIYLFVSTQDCEHKFPFIVIISLYFRTLNIVHAFLVHWTPKLVVEILE